MKYESKMVMITERCWKKALLALFVSFCLGFNPLLADESNCLDCHSEAEEGLPGSVHEGSECIECHVNLPMDEDADDIHGLNPPKAECQECHEDSWQDRKDGKHAIDSDLLLDKSKKTCASCHGSHKIVEVRQVSSLTSKLIGEKISESVHDGLECQDCHTAGLASAGEEKVDCSTCHEDIAEIYAKSIHGEQSIADDGKTAQCTDCHGSHRILSSSHRDSRVHKFNTPATCAACHDQKELVEEFHIDQPEAVSLFVDSMHGQALLDMGLLVAPSCNDCHGVHNIQKHEHPESPIHHDNIPDTCGKCHYGVEQVYNDSIHGQVLAKGDPKGPVCTDCHTSHNIGMTDGHRTKIQNDKTCGKCHDDKLANYRETYHGKAMALGEGKVAACFNCHGSHNIYSKEDSRSLLFRGVDEEGNFQDNLLQTCQECHPKAESNFAGYLAHADHNNKEEYPVLYWVFFLMTGLLISVFILFGFHTVFWLARTLYFYFTDREGFRAAKIKQHHDEEVYTRFRPVDRFIHGLIIISFLLLVITGMPIKFYYADWAKVMFSMLGGSEAARALHRIGAFITIVYFALHVWVMMYRVAKAWQNTRAEHNGKFTLKGLMGILFGPDSPVPNKQDWHDIVAHQKFFFGKGPRPQFDTWTYWEKFDYWAVFWGIAVIGLSGLIMWFPETFTKVLPGIAINIALIIHSDEALLAAGFIFTFHFFNVHFRPEKFPIDSVIFSGRITKAELEQERGRFLKRMIVTGKLKEIRHKDEWDAWKKILHPLGYLAFGIGVFLIVLIYWAMGARLISG